MEKLIMDIAYELASMKPNDKDTPIQRKTRKQLSPKQTSLENLEHFQTMNKLNYELIEEYLG